MPSAAPKMRVRDARVAARRVDEDLVAGQAAVGQGVEHHPQRRPVLDAAAGVRELELRPDLHVGHVDRDLAEAHERRVAHGVDDGLDPAAARPDQCAHDRPSSEQRRSARRASRAPSATARADGSRNSERLRRLVRRRRRRRRGATRDALTSTRTAGSTAAAAAASPPSRTRRYPDPGPGEVPSRHLAGEAVGLDLDGRRRDARLARRRPPRRAATDGRAGLHSLSPRRWRARC